MEGKSCTQEGHNSLVTSSWTFHQNKLFSSLKILFLPSKMKSSGHFPFPAENFLSHSLIDSRRCSLWRSSTCKLHKSRISFPGGLEGLEQKKKAPFRTASGKVALPRRQTGDTQKVFLLNITVESCVAARCSSTREIQAQSRIGMPNATAIPLRKLEPGRPSLLAAGSDRIVLRGICADVCVVGCTGRVLTKV